MHFKSVESVFPAAKLEGNYMFCSHALNHSRTPLNTHEEVGKIEPKISLKNYKPYA